MEEKNSERGYAIAKSIRGILFKLDLTLVYAEGERKLAHEKMKLNGKIGTAKAKKASMKAKMVEGCYKVYIKNVMSIKEDVNDGIEWVLQRYAPRYRDVWRMYFLEQRTIDEICEALCYSRSTIDRIVRQLKEDISDSHSGMPTD